jgi:hypothetical protein
MITFESEYIKFQQRLLNFENLVAFGLFIFFSYIVIFRFKLYFFHTIITEFTLFTILVIIIINKSKSNIDLISFEENTLILCGETFNKRWKKSLNLKETNIEIKSIPSRNGLQDVIFYLKIKNKNDNYIINSLNTFSDEGIIKIFNEFKKHKEEKIVFDERFAISRIQEKIEKCQ